MIFPLEKFGHCMTHGMGLCIRCRLAGEAEGTAGPLQPRRCFSNVPAVVGVRPATNRQKPGATKAAVNVGSIVKGAGDGSDTLSSAMVARTEIIEGDADDDVPPL
jgi:hypothetical protein